MKRFTFLAIILMVILMMTGCQSGAVKDIDESILYLSKQKVSIASGEAIRMIREQMDALSPDDLASLENTAKFDSYCAEYMKLEDAAVAEIEAAIDALPAAKDIRLDSENKILKVESMLNGAPEFVKNRVKNADAVETKKAEMEKYKESCKTDCKTCGGDGKFPCALCGGRGSRKVDYQTPNGKVWQVYQDCAKWNDCSICGGAGYVYVDK